MLLCHLLPAVLRTLPACALSALKAPAAVLAKSRPDGARTVAGGNRDGREELVGSASDSAVATPRSSSSLKERETELRQWVARRRVWVAASTHEGEEEGTGDDADRRV